MSTKGNVLKALEENKGKTVSGEELASSLAVSRSAIWKVIQDLRKEGYSIDAITNKGYCLSQKSDLLSVEGIVPHIKSCSMSEHIHVFKSLESTNQTAKKMAMDGAPAGTLVIAEEQTKGRGRLGRSFYSPPNSGIYMSFILKPHIEIAKSVLITTAASVAVCRAIENITGISCQIKWVNDIYIAGKKICGLLTEAVTDFESGNIEFIVLGIGINYSTASSTFANELLPMAGSIFDGTKAADPTCSAPVCGGLPSSDVSRNRLIAEIINTISEISNELEARAFIDEYKARSLVLGKDIKIIPTGSMEKNPDLAEGIAATAIDIDRDGGLVVMYSDGKISTLNSGEISIRTIL